MSSITIEQATMFVCSAILDAGYTTAPQPETVAELALRLMTELGALDQVDMGKLMASATTCVEALRWVMKCKTQISKTKKVEGW